MNASFYALFRRGKYGRLSLHSGATGDKTPHEERERFVASALGFTLRHSKFFRHWFLKSFLKLPISNLEITMDENQWADLKLTGKDGGNFLCVIETKTGAQLNTHQNPSESRFWEKGYGQKLRNEKQSHPNRVVKYCVLDVSERKPAKNRYEIKCIAKTWHEFAHNVPRDTLVTDLIELLIDIGLPLSITTKNTNKMKTNKLDLLWLCELHHELSAIADEYGLKLVEKEKVGESKNPFFGSQFRGKTKSSVFNVKTRPNQGWFGWELIKNQHRRSLWFYSSPDEGVGKRIFQHLKDKKFKPEKDGARIYLSERPTALASDTKWFRSIFDALK